MADRKQPRPSSADAARIADMRQRIAAVPFAQELLDIEEQVAGQTFFEKDMKDSIGRCYFGTALEKPVVALNPDFSDDKIVSFYVHELSHLRQSCLAGDRYVSHPEKICDVLLLGVFMREADAYMRQYLFACEAFVHGDKSVLASMGGLKLEDLEKSGVAKAESALLHSEEAGAYLNARFWSTMRQLMSTPSLFNDYLLQVIDAISLASSRLDLLDAGHFKSLDSLPRETALKDCFDDLRKIATLSPEGDGQDVDYLAEEQGDAFFARFQTMMPESGAKLFTQAKEVFVSDFYAAMKKAEQKPEKKAAPKPAPRSFKK